MKRSGKPVTQTLRRLPMPVTGPPDSAEGDTCDRSCANVQALGSPIEFLADLLIPNASALGT
jgi:hypothetical protein